MEKMSKSKILIEDQVKEFTKLLVKNLPEAALQYLPDPEEIFRMFTLGKKFEKERIDAGKSIKNLAQELKVAQYRVKAIEQAQVGQIEPTVLQKYSDYLGLNEWCFEWAAINEELAEKLGIPHWN